jgi:hypothetical protein
MSKITPSIASHLGMPALLLLSVTLTYDGGVVALGRTIRVD